MRIVGVMIGGLALAAVAGGFFMAAPVDAQQTASPVVVVNMAQIQSQSTAFADLRQKLKTVVEQQSNAFSSQNGALKTQIETEARNLRPRLQGKTEQQILADPALKQAYEAQARREQDFGQKAELFRLSVQQTQANAERQILTLLDPVVGEVMTQRGATVVLERSSVMKAVPGVDVTNDVVARFNQRQPAAPVVAWSPVQLQQAPAAPAKK
jgi:outer membrane protein